MSFFKKPAWKQKQQALSETTKIQSPDSKSSSDPSHSADLFSRSRKDYVSFVAEQEAKDREREEKRKAKEAERKDKARSNVKRDWTKTEPLINIDDIEDGSPTPKRTRISSDSALTRSDDPAPALRSSPMTSPEPHHSRDKGKQREVVEIDDEDPLPVEEPWQAPSEPKLTPPPEDEIDLDPLDPDEDESISQLVREAQRAARQRLNEAEDTSEETNPTITIYIEPHIPDTDALIVKRRFKQKLGPVRLAWCRQNELDDRQAKDVILTWMKLRVFDSVTLRSLGIELNEEGIPVKKSAGGYSERMDQLRMVVTTQAIQEQERKQAEEEAEMARKAREQEAVGEEKELPKADVEKRFKLVLRSQGDAADLKLIVKLDTEIQKIVSNYRRQLKVPEDKTVVILLDGDALNPSDLVRDTELMDYDDDEPILLDVSVK